VTVASSDRPKRSSLQQTEKLLLTPEAAAELLSVGRTAIYDLMARGELSSVRIGRSRRIPIAALHEFVEGLALDD
jgi:excisionase family DNA binding protein